MKRSNLRSLLHTILLAISFLLASGMPLDAQWLRKAGPDSDILAQQARKEMERRNYPRAVELLKKASGLSPYNWDIRLLYGRALFLNKQYDAAKDELVYLIRRQPKYKDAYTYLVNLETERRNWPDALCYADDCLNNYPGDREMALKKLDILTHFRDREMSNRYADNLLERYPNDTVVFRAYLDSRIASGINYKRSGNIARARYDFEQVLEHDPTNKEALDEVFNLELRSGNYQGSLAFVNRALQTSPNSYNFLLKKVGLLEEMHEYAEAIATNQKILKFYPNDRLSRQLDVELRMAAGRYYMNTDPYLQFQSVLEKSPGNREALNYVVNLSFSRGLYPETLRWINLGLRSSPGDAELMAKKIGVLEQMKNYTEAANLAERLYQRGAGRVTREQYMDLKVLSGKQYMSDLQYDSAMTEFQAVLNMQPNHVDALNYSIALATAQKNYEDALRILDDALRYYPGSDALAFRKAGLLEASGRFAEAASISRELLARYPENRKYLAAYIDQSLAAGKQSMQAEDYEQSVGLLREILVAQPGNTDALTYLINMESALQRYDSAVYYADLALQQYPDSREFLFKKASVLTEAKRYREAYAITNTLYQQYPYYPKYRQAFIDQLLASGRQYQVAGQADSALTEYAMALQVSARDTNALFYSINLLADAKQYDTALGLVHRATYYYPENPNFWLKKAVMYENLNRYSEAVAALDTFRVLRPADQRQLDYADYLKSRSLKNEFGLFYLRSTYDYYSNTRRSDSIGMSTRRADIATINYLRRWKKGTYAVRLNYAGRISGTGLQLEGETFYNHDAKWASYGVAAIGNGQVFPSIRLGYSIYHNFKGGYEGEAGIRYLKLIDTSGSVVSLVGGASRTYGDFWVNLRGFQSFFNSKSATSAILMTRYFINEKSDYLQGSFGFGTIPDDRSLNYKFTGIAAIRTVFIGAGAQKQFKYRTTAGVYGTWYNNRLGTTGDGKLELFQNQYDIYFTLMRKF
jgi:YaiO family outer membrane protein